jgi:hypothetical protein
LAWKPKFKSGACSLQCGGRGAEKGAQTVIFRRLFTDIYFMLVNGIPIDYPLRFSDPLTPSLPGMASNPTLHQV